MTNDPTIPFGEHLDSEDVVFGAEVEVLYARIGELNRELVRITRLDPLPFAEQIKFHRASAELSGLLDRVDSMIAGFIAETQ